MGPESTPLENTRRGGPAAGGGGRTRRWQHVTCSTSRGCQNQHLILCSLTQVESMENNGGTLMLRTPVEKILIEKCVLVPHPYTCSRADCWRQSSYPYRQPPPTPAQHAVWPSHRTPPVTCCAPPSNDHLSSIMPRSHHSRTMICSLSRTRWRDLWWLLADSPPVWLAFMCCSRPYLAWWC